MKTWVTENQASLFEPMAFDRLATRQRSNFDGASFDAALDSERLGGQMARVFSVMRDGKWRTLSELQAVIHSRFGKHDSEAGLSARLRDARKQKFGGHTVLRQRRQPATAGLFEYRLEIRRTL